MHILLHKQNFNSFLNFTIKTMTKSDIDLISACPVEIHKESLYFKKCVDYFNNLKAIDFPEEVSLGDWENCDTSSVVISRQSSYFSERVEIRSSDLVEITQSKHSNEYSDTIQALEDEDIQTLELILH